MTSQPNRADVERFRAVVARRFGLNFDDDRLDHLADVLRQLGGADHGARFGAYIDRVASMPRSSTELRALVEQLTVNETFFFRNPDNFRAFTERLLHDRAPGSESRARRLRILSAGCASGEEPYSVAIALREALPDLERWDANITGIDINAAMLEKAARARYSAWALRETPEDIRRRYFRPDGRDFLLDPRVRSMVAFEERNLIEADASLWQPASYDVVFCRNVIMYLTPEVMHDVIRRVCHSLVPGGLLFLGHAETLRGLSQDFHLCHTHDTFYYQKRDGATVHVGETSGPARLDDAAGASLPRVIDDAASWVDAIQRASEHVAALADVTGRARDSGAATTAAAPLPTTRSWDLGVVLEAMRQERFADALALLSALPSESQGETDALLLRAVLLTNAGDLDEAEHVCRRLLALDELNAGAHYLMALCREHAADCAGATEHDKTAVYLDPVFAMPHLHLGLIARRAGDQVTAEHELLQAVALLAREDSSRLLLFGGGFSREALLALARTELGTVRGGR